MGSTGILRQCFMAIPSACFDCLRCDNPKGVSPMNAMWSWWWQCCCRPGGCMCRCTSVFLSGWWFAWSFIRCLWLGMFTFGHSWDMLGYAAGRPMMVKVYHGPWLWLGPMFVYLTTQFRGQKWNDPGATRRCSWVIGTSFTWTAWMIRSRPTWCPPSYVQKKNGWRVRSPVVTWRMSEAPWKNLRAVSLRPQPKLLNSVHTHFLCCL